MAIYIGVDPGTGGGIAAVGDDGALIEAVPMPETVADLLEVIGRYRGGMARAALERVWTSPQMGVVSAGTFMRNVGRLEAALAACGIPYDQPTPATWQRVLGVLDRTGRRDIREAAKGKKNAHKARAQQLFPTARVTHATADALLLAEYARRQGLAPSFSAPRSAP